MQVSEDYTMELQRQKPGNDHAYQYAEIY